MSRWLQAARALDVEETPCDNADGADTSSSPAPTVGIVSIVTPPFFGGACPREIDLAERAAILEHDNGVPRPEADDRAAREAGFPDAAAYRGQLLSYWRWGVRRIITSRPHKHAEEHARAALTFIDGGWAEKAIALGWSEAELMWCDERAPWARYDRMGAAYFSQRIAAITADHFVFSVPGGGRRTLPRHRGDGIGDVPWRDLYD